MTMIYARDGAAGDVHLIPVTQLGALCGKERTDFHGCDGPVTCPGCLRAARAAFDWVLGHYADDVQSKATTAPVVPLGRIDQRGRALPEPEDCRVAAAIEEAEDTWAARIAAARPWRGGTR